MRRKYVALTLGLVMTGMLLGGCGNSKDTGSTADIASSKDAAASSSPSTDQKSSDKKDENTVYGKITKADGNTITYEVLERQDNGASKPEGTPPAQKDNSNSNSDQQQSDSSNTNSDQKQSDSSNTNSDQKPEGTPPAKPEGSADPQASGAPQGKDDKGKGGFSSTGETQTFTVSDDTTVKIVTMKDGSADSSDGSVSDLTKGTMIRIQYTDSSKKRSKKLMYQKWMTINKVIGNNEKIAK